MNGRNIYLLLTISSLYMLCIRSGEVAGVGSETTNGIVGIVLNQDNTPESHAVVQLIPGSYDVVRDGILSPKFTDTTDESGSYHFSRISEGFYSIMARSCCKKTAALITGINISKDTVTAQEAILGKTGVIKVTVPRSSFEPNDGYVYIPGTTLYGLADSNSNEIIIGSVPTGIMPKIVYSIKDSSIEIIIRDSLEVIPEDTTVVTNPEWKYSKRLYLNTTRTGADVAENVYDFPVLIRLNQNTFNFSQAKADGADILFTKSDNTILPFEIERWDLTMKMAEIWVKVDTISGNNKSQYINMYWGNETAQAVSSDTSTFSTRYGWAGVWHLGEDKSDTGTVGLYHNSVEYVNYGNDIVFSQGKTGVIGRGQNFTPSTQKTSERFQIRPDLISVPGATSRLKPQMLTVSAWVQIFKPDSSGCEIFSMGDNYLLRVDATGYFRFVMYHDSSTYVTSTDYSVNLIDSLWHCIICTYDGSEVRSYVDGVLRNSSTFTDGINYIRGTDFVFGAHGAHKLDFNMDGCIDEVTISSVVRSQAWVKLTYENQRIGSLLISY